MSQPFDIKFRDELWMLADLFGAEKIIENYSRVKEIYEHTEAAWCHYVRSLEHIPIRYLLIAEAPPWSNAGTPQYVLDPSCKSGSFITALKGTFICEKSATHSECLKTFSDQGLLVMDSIPFAMNYSPKRSTKKYDTLVKKTTITYLQAKLNSYNLVWSPDIRIAFAVTRNARSILKSVKTLHLGDQNQPITEHMIAVNKAGYPDSEKLRHIFKLK